MGTVWDRDGGFGISSEVRRGSSLHELSCPRSNPSPDLSPLVPCGCRRTPVDKAATDQRCPDCFLEHQGDCTPLALETAAARAALLADPARIAAAGLTWEYLSSLGPMDAAAWEAMIPQMGYMALLRNLRNFDQAGVSDEVADTVAKRLTDPDEVAKSRQFPYRFLSAYRATESLRWALPLERALTLACSNIPELPGRTLVLVDTSASMRDPLSSKSKVRHIDVAGLFGMATALRNPGRCDFVGFADAAFGWEPPKGSSVLRQIDLFDSLIGSVGHGTNMLGALAAAYKDHDRVLIFSDLQTSPYLRGGGMGWSRGGASAEDILRGQQVDLFGVNTAGYAATPIDSAKPGRYEIGGFSDQLFKLVAMVSAGRSVSWPWEAPTG